MNSLDALHCPLTGVNLIEASAGTGKTWTLSALYIRLLLASDDKAALTIDQILVVTYTKAATAELRERLRLRLYTLFNLLQGQYSDDSFLQALERQYPSGPTRDCAIERLQIALANFDTAAIYTIHGFCQRALSDAAFETGCRFTTELIQDDSSRLLELADDFWRIHLVNQPVLAQWLIATKQTPEQWLNDVRPYLSKPYLQLMRPTASMLSHVHSQLLDHWQEVVQHAIGIDEAMELIAHTRLNARTFNPSKCANALIILKQHLAQATHAFVWSLEDQQHLKLLTTSSLQKNTLKGQTTIQHPLFDAVERWLNTLDAYQQALHKEVITLKLNFIDWMNAQLANRRQRECQRSFDDLLTELGSALQHPKQGAALQNRLAMRFKVALIDEFQDTDPLQYSLFKMIFIQKHRPVFLVGDPKQAIYRFRGADIFAYLAARADAQYHYTLDSNWRSSAALLNAVNALFQRAQPFVLPQINYLPVKASPLKREELIIEDDRTPFNWLWLNFDHNTKGANKQNAEYAAIDATVAETAQLLNLAQQEQAFFLGPQGRRKLTGGDIAILVLTHRQGEAIRQALAKLNIASVTLTQASVYQTQEAYELWIVLRALAQPSNENDLRRALATELIGLNAATLYDLQENEAEWESWRQKGTEHYERWLHHSFIAMWRSFFMQHRLAQRLLPLADGTRRLTNLAHLAELLQAASQTHPSPARLVAWLETQIAKPIATEESLLRLDNEAALVKIVTIHRAKGLQYPIVFCPFMWQGSNPIPNQAFCCIHQQQQSYLIATDLLDSEQKRQVEQEALAEKMRLLYVALTRAQQRQYIVWGWVQKIEKAALTRCIYSEAPLNAADTQAGLEHFVRHQQDPKNASIHLACCGLGLTLPNTPPPKLIRARHFNRLLTPSWRIASFSWVSAQLTTPSHQIKENEEAQAIGADYNRYTFPRGRRAGTCLHTILETLNPQASQREAMTHISHILKRFGFDLIWLDAAYDLIFSALHIELAPGISLAKIAPGKKIIELAFIFPVHTLCPATLSALLSDPAMGLAPPLQHAAKQLNFGMINGYLKGFIDLVFEDQGRIYLVDYKSNFLGHTPAAYTSDTLVHGIAAEHYYLQYLLYSVALRRYFNARGINFDACFAGVYYLYLRGLGKEKTGIWHDQPTPHLLEALDQLFN